MVLKWLGRKLLPSVHRTNQPGNSSDNNMFSNSHRVALLQVRFRGTVKLSRPFRQHQPIQQIAHRQRTCRPLKQYRPKQHHEPHRQSLFFAKTAPAVTPSDLRSPAPPAESYSLRLPREKYTVLKFCMIKNYRPVRARSKWKQRTV